MRILAGPFRPRIGQTPYTETSIRIAERAANQLRRVLGYVAMEPAGLEPATF
jgi:hypothetical protein